MPFCTNCGEKIEKTELFCGNCGYNIREQEAAPLPNLQIPKQPQPPQMVKSYEVNLIGNISGAFLNLFLPRKPLTKISSTVYGKLPPMGFMGSLRIFIISIALFIGFYILEYGGQVYSVIDSNLMYFIATYSVAIIYLIWVYRSDRYEREPFKLILLLFSWGVFSGIIAGILNSMFSPVATNMLGSDTIIAPVVEEIFKAAGLYYVLTRDNIKKEFNTPLDGIVFGFAAGLGFFAMENFYYFMKFQGDTSVLVIRSFLTWIHGIWVATTGLWLAISKVQRGYLIKTDLIPGLLVAITLHFIWNGFLAGNIIGWVLIVYYVWYTRKILKEALRDEVNWGYDSGLAPVE